MGFPSSNDGDLRVPLMWPQGSSVSIRISRGSTALLSCHSRGIGPQDVLKGEDRDLSGVAAGNPGVPGHVTVTSGSFSGYLREVRNIVDLQRPLGSPLGSVQWKKASFCVEAVKTGLFLTCGGKLSLSLELGRVSLETSGVS